MKVREVIKRLRADGCYLHQTEADSLVERAELAGKQVADAGVPAVWGSGADRAGEDRQAGERGVRFNIVISQMADSLIRFEREGYIPKTYYVRLERGKREIMEFRMRPGTKVRYRKSTVIVGPLDIGTES